VPSLGIADGDVLGEKLIDELTRLGCRTLECTATMTYASKSKAPAASIHTRATDSRKVA
jgi:hypothetical protein